MKNAILSLLLFANCIALAQDSLSLEDCHRLTRERWKIQQVIELSKAQSELSIKNINAAYLPEAVLFGSSQYQSDVTKITIPFPNIKIPEVQKDQHKLGLNVNQLIWDGGISSARKELETLQAEIAAANAEIEFAKLKEQVNKAFFSIFIIKANLESLEVLQSDFAERLSVSKKTIESGVALQSGYDAIRAEMLKIRQQKSELKALLKSSHDALNELTGLKTDTSAALKLPTAIINSAYEKLRKEFAVFELSRKKADEAKKLSETKFNPMVASYFQTAYGKPGLNMFDEDFQPYWLAGIKASWNFWDWGASSREGELAEIRKQLIDIQESSFEKNLEITRKHHINEIARLEEQLAEDKEIAELRRSIANAQKSKFDNGTVTATEYIIENNSFRRAELALELRKLEIVKTKVNLLTQMGAL